MRREHLQLQSFAWDDERNEVVAEGNTLPAAWDGDPDTLPEGGIHAVLESGLGTPAPDPTVLCALQIMVAPERQGEGFGFPGVLVPFQIDRRSDRGVYVEPNVWMRHRLG